MYFVYISLFLSESDVSSIQSPLEGLSAAKIMNKLGVQGNLISAYRGKELVLGIDRVSLSSFIFFLQ